MLTRCGSPRSSCTGCTRRACSGYLLGGGAVLTGRFQYLLGFNDLGGIVHDLSVFAEQNRRIFPEFLHIRQQLCGGGIAVLRVQCHGLHDDLLQPARNIGIQGRGHGRAAVDMLNGYGHRGFPVIGRPSGHHFVHHHAQTVQVAAVIHPSALGLFGGYVVHRAKRLLGQGIALGHNPGDSEIRHLD